ncbi:kinase-like domain-containing protein [Rhizophagus irregularis DAOM 181602=DAOM 197198]|nr:kinase-like domain-containing protein [Rhizophagus irregularis DAOM 181602=DAOM 197198]
MKQIGEGGFAKVYSATWIDGMAKYIKQDDGNWIKEEPEPIQVALKRLNGSQNMSSDLLNELKTHWKLNCLQDFGLSRPSNEQKSSDSNKIVGVLPYIAPEVLNGEPYTLSSDIYSFGVVMTELSSGKPPFYKRKHDGGLALEICNGLRPEFGKGTPEIYKKLAHRCMNANPNQRPIANELEEILNCWDNYKDNEKYGYKGEEVKAVFEEADKEIPNISTSYEKKPDAIYTSRAFTFSNLSKPINSSFIATTYLNEEDNEGCQDSQLVDLEVPNTSKLEEDNSDN